ncbi:hypothetical protein B0H17DRAFT_588716 [Mycena rosella]|uniref:Uncharacterized protein n=1 Tax=Mycena rosella TaxID=1033263 RepID=A0AAD7GH04_MYCRO|nr:hypothetical protein B0H17DRAFT_588716 [Mycena rosella]
MDGFRLRPGIIPTPRETRLRRCSRETAQVGAMNESRVTIIPGKFPGMHSPSIIIFVDSPHRSERTRHLSILYMYSANNRTPRRPSRIRKMLQCGAHLVVRMLITTTTLNNCMRLRVKTMHHTGPSFPTCRRPIPDLFALIEVREAPGVRVERAGTAVLKAAVCDTIRFLKDVRQHRDAAQLTSSVKAGPRYHHVRSCGNEEETEEPGCNLHFDVP